MVKQWKKSLEQTDIVSDGEPFLGAHIDQPISEAGGGIDWREEYYSDVSFSDTGEIIDGSGVAFFASARPNSSNVDPTDRFSLQFEIDNEYTWASWARVEAGNLTLVGPVRFENSVSVDFIDELSFGVLHYVLD